MRIFTSAPIRKGDETVVYSGKKHKVGASVSIFSVLVVTSAPNPSRQARSYRPARMNPQRQSLPPRQASRTQAHGDGYI